MNRPARFALLALASLPLLRAPSALAAQAEYLVMTPLEEVRQKCQHDLPSHAVTCILDGTTIGEPAQWLPKGSVTENLSQDEWAAGAQVGLVLELTTRTAANGVPLLVATGYQTLSTAPQQKETRFAGALWKTVRGQLYVKPVDDPLAVQFLHDATFSPTPQQLAARQDAAKEAEARAYVDSPEGQRLIAAEQIINCDDQIREAREVLARDDRIAAVSGYENKLDRRRAGERIVECQDAMKEYWADYRRNGGKARTVQALRNP